MNRIKTGIKLHVTPEESRVIQEICRRHVGIGAGLRIGLDSGYVGKKYLYIDTRELTCGNTIKEFKEHPYEEVDAKFFIKTNCVCIEETPEQAMLKEILNKNKKGGAPEQPTEAKPKQYLVFVPTKGKPKHIHQSLESAQEEAKRLCKSGLCEVMVLEVVSKYQAKVIVEEV